MALRLASQLHDNLGLECHVKPMHWTSIFSKMTQGTFQMSLVQWYPLANDPIIALNSFKHAQDSMNMSGWEHPDFQRWLELSDNEIDPLKRAQYLRQAEEYLAKEAPVVPLVYEPSQALVKCSLHVTHSQSFDLARSYFNPTSTNKKR
jgi:ABC-type oligopeptide transport system substrate-binding subunit